MPTLEFHQRHNKPCFWLSHIWLPWAHSPVARVLTGGAAPYIPYIPASIIYCSSPGWLLPMNYQLLSWLKETFIGDEMEDNLLLQDFILPLQHVKEALLLNQAISAIYPVWLVPAR